MFDPLDPNPVLNLLFDRGEATCFSPDVYGIEVRPVAPYAGAVFFSINPLRESRRDANVTRYRNFLIECDKHSVQDQMAHFEAIKIPAASIVFSGKKSCHAIVSVEDFPQDEHTYKAYAKKIFEAVGLDRVDTSTKNLSRFSRYPGAVRPDTKVHQSVFHLGRRISFAELQAWLKERGVGLEVSACRQFDNQVRSDRCLSAQTHYFLIFGAKVGEQDNKLFWASCDHARAGYTLEEAERNLLPMALKLGFKEGGARKTIRSGYKRVQEAGQAQKSS